MINDKEKIWSVDHYRESEFFNSPINVAISGFTIQYSPQYYIEEFIAKFKKIAKNGLNEELTKEINSLTTPSDINSKICNLVCYHNDIASKNSRNIASFWILDGGSSFHESIEAGATIATAAVKDMLVSLVKANSDKISDNLINFLISLDPSFAEYFIQNKKITKDAAMYLTLTQPSCAIKMLDGADILTATMIDALLRLNPLAVYHVPSTIKAWRIKDHFSDGREHITKTIYSRHEYIDMAIGYAIDIAIKCKKLNDECCGLFQISEDWFYDSDIHYDKFSYSLDLQDKEKIISFLVNQRDDAKRIHELRAIGNNILKVKKPTTEDMNTLGNNFLTELNSKIKFMKSDKEKFDPFMKYIEKHKKLMDKDLYEDICSKYYADALLDEMRPFGVDFPDDEKEK